MAETPNLTDNRTPSIIASVTVLWVVGITAVGLRLYSRHVSHMSLGWDDWLVLFAMALPFTGTCIANYVGASLGAGKHLTLVIEKHPEHVGPFLKYIYGVELLYPWIIGPLKCSILSLYVRLFGVQSWLRIYCFTLMSLTVMWAIAVELGSVFQCTPIWQAWNPESDRSMCVNLQRFLVGTNVPNIVLDFLILIAPLHSIWRLRLPTKRKIIVSGILMLGAGEIVFSIVRLATLTSLDTSDATWNYFGAIIWSTVEQSIGILCVCLPVLGPLMPTWLIGSMSSRSNDSGYHNSQNAPYTLQSFGPDGDRSQLTNSSSADHENWNFEPQDKSIRRTTSVRIQHSYNKGPSSTYA